LDLALSKEFRITERLRTQFRGELFNVMNFVNFASPSGAITSAGFGAIRAITGKPRIVQFALNLTF